MLHLSTATFPSSTADLESQLIRALEQIFALENDPVSFRGSSYPHLEEAHVSLDGARLLENAPRPPVISGEISPALKIDQLTVSASPLFLGPCRVSLSASAREVQLGQGKDSNGQIVLCIDSLVSGQMEISIAQADLEAAIVELAKSKGTKQGITIDNLQLKLREKSPRSVSAEVHFRVRKLFLTASIRVTGQLDLDDELNLKISSLACSGDGGMATLVCGILKPYLQKIDSREFPLMSLPLGKIQLRDVRLVVGDNISITAEFGSASQI